LCPGRSGEKSTGYGSREGRQKKAQFNRESSPLTQDIGKNHYAQDNNNLANHRETVANLFSFKMKVKKEMTPSKMNLLLFARKFPLSVIKNLTL